MTSTQTDMRPGQRRPFVALLRAVAAIIQGDPQRLAAAFTLVEPDALLEVAARHKCSGFLFRGMKIAAVSDPTGGRLSGPLKTAAGSMAVRAHVVKLQLDALLQTLLGAKVSCVLLKGAARLYTGEPEASFNALYDLDLLIRAQDADAALLALERAGYRSAFNERHTAAWRARHRHLAPLHPPGDGVPVELHFELAAPDSLSIRMDWVGIAPYVAPIRGDAGVTARLNPLGTALHLALHGMNVRRLHDVALLARLLRDDPSLIADLYGMLVNEPVRRVAIRGVLALAACVAGLPVAVTPSVRRYLDWAVHREGLPAYVRPRTYALDAWYGNGGSARAALGAMHREVVGPARDIDNVLRAPLRIAGSLAISGWARFLNSSPSGLSILTSRDVLGAAM